MGYFLKICGLGGLLLGQTQGDALDDRDGLVQSEGVIGFTKKSLFDHLRGVACRWRSILRTALAVFGVVWTMAESVSYFIKADLSGTGRFFTVLVFSVISAVALAVYTYIADAPPGLEQESVKAKRIAQIQRTRWEAELTRQLMYDVLDQLDEELAAFRRGRVFVAVDESLSRQDYVAWAQRRLYNIERMMEVGQLLLVVDFLAALISDYSLEKPAQIRSVVYQVRDFYQSTVQFELDRLRVQPPEGAERLHELLADWAEPIRDAVRQLYGIVDEILAANLKSDSKLSLKVTMASPSNVEAACDEMERLGRLWAFG